MPYAFFFFFFLSNLKVYVGSKAELKWFFFGTDTAWACDVKWTASGIFFIGSGQGACVTMYNEFVVLTGSRLG